MTRPTTQLEELVTCLLRTHHVTTRILLDEASLVLAAIVASAPRRCPAPITTLRRTFAYFRDDLLAHLRTEERAVFPYIEQLALALASGGDPPRAVFHSLTSPVQVMRNEQEGTRLAMSRLDADFLAARRAHRPQDPTWVELADILERLAVDLAEHVRIEQDELFPAAVAAEERLSRLHAPPPSALDPHAPTLTMRRR